MLPKPRRVQARGEGTRLRILEATLACIVDEGYAQTTTVRVCELSGTSRGSLLHEFSTRAELMAAAVTSRWDQAMTTLHMPRTSEQALEGLDHDQLDTETLAMTTHLGAAHGRINHLDSHLQLPASR